MKQRLLFVVFYIISCLFNLSAQVGFSIPDISNAQAGDILDLPITVTNFDSIVASQFVIRWDPSVLQFQSTGNYNLPDLDEGKFGTSQAIDSGFVRLVWWYYTDAGTSKTDNSSIFHIKLKVIGPINSGSTIVFTEIAPQTLFEVLKVDNTSYNQSQVNLDNGFVAVGYVPTSAIWSLAESNFKIQTFPNPIFDNLYIKFDLPVSEKVHINIIDNQGLTIFEKKQQFPAGSNGMEIASHIFSKKDIYYLIIRINQFSHIETLLNIN
jgi:Cohesin domain